MINKVDRQALDYLLSSAAAIGFDAITVHVHEDKVRPPEVSICFYQVRTPYMPVAQEAMPENVAPLPEKDKMRTLDDDPEVIS